MTAPHNLDEIITIFGDIRAYIAVDGRLEPRWQTDFLERVFLPFPLHLSWNPSLAIAQMTCHRRLSAVFSSVFKCIEERGLHTKIANFGMLCRSSPAHRS
jgi:hypothetical protein